MLIIGIHFCQELKFLVKFQSMKFGNHYDLKEFFIFIFK